MQTKQAVRVSVYGFLAGLFISGLILIGIRIGQSRHPSSSLASNSVTIHTQFNPTSDSSTDKIDLNLASQFDLDSLPGIGIVKAQSILDFRDKYGPFMEISELLYVPGIGQELYNSIKEMVIISH